MLLRWESDTRYYLVHVSPDLFGDTTIRRVWGSRSSAHGNEMFEVVSGPDLSAEIRLRLIELNRRRLRRGYRLVSGFLPE